MVLSLPLAGGWLLLSQARTFPTLLAGRLLTGFAGGAFLLAAPAYSEEIAHPRHRGALASLAQLLLTLGILFVNVNCRTDWRLLSGVCAAFPLLLLLVMVWMPRSPVHLVTCGKVEEARAALRWLRGAGWPGVEEELARLQEEVVGRVADVGPVGLWRRREHRLPCLLSLALMALANLSGVDYILSYSTVIFQSSGTSIDPCISSILIGVVMVAGTLVTIFTIDKFGRKILLVISSIFICISTLGVGLHFHLGETCGDACGLADQLSWLPLASLLLFILMISIGLGPVPWVMNIELMPPESMVGM